MKEKQARGVGVHGDGAKGMNEHALWADLEEVVEVKEAVLVGATSIKPELHTDSPLSHTFVRARSSNHPPQMLVSIFVDSFFKVTNAPTEDTFPANIAQKTRSRERHFLRNFRRRYILELIKLQPIIQQR